jgi:hypothetical protein
MSELALILLESHVFVPCMLRSNLLTLISNQINISEENLNEQFFLLGRKNLLKNFSKIKYLFGAAKPMIDNFH